MLSLISFAFLCASNKSTNRLVFKIKSHQNFNRYFFITFWLYWVLGSPASLGLSPSTLVRRGKTSLFYIYFKNLGIGKFSAQQDTLCERNYILRYLRIFFYPTCFSKNINILLSMYIISKFVETSCICEPVISIVHL